MSGISSDQNYWNYGIPSFLKDPDYEAPTPEVLEKESKEFEENESSELGPINELPAELFRVLLNQCEPSSLWNFCQTSKVFEKEALGSLKMRMEMGSPSLDRLDIQRKAKDIHKISRRMWSLRNVSSELPEEIIRLHDRLIGTYNPQIADKIKEYLDYRDNCIFWNSLGAIFEKPKDSFSFEELKKFYEGIDPERDLLESQRSMDNFELCNRELTSVPSDLLKHFTVKHLMATGNLITEIPEKLCDMAALTNLTLTKNKIRELPKNIGNLKNLTSLALGGNQLRELSPELCKLSKLQYLNVYGNSLQELPENIGDLEDLIRIDLPYNQIKSLPESLGSLRKLTVLSLDHNQIERPPARIGNLKKLKTLILKYNKIQEVTKAVCELEDLDNLVLSNNPIQKLPNEIFMLEKPPLIHLSKDALGSVAESLQGRVCVGCNSCIDQITFFGF